MRYLIPLIVVALLTTAASAQYPYSHGYKTDYSGFTWNNRYGQPRGYFQGPGVRQFRTFSYKAGGVTFHFGQSVGPRPYPVPVQLVPSYGRSGGYKYPTYKYPSYGYGR
jgi:hypothetical protein